MSAVEITDLPLYLSRLPRKPGNPNDKGAVGVGRAVAYYMSLGWAVFTPVSDICKYDLLVDDRLGHIYRIEVKSSWSANNVVGLISRSGSNTNNGWGEHATRKEYGRISIENCDFVYIVNMNNGVEREYPAAALDGLASIKLV